MAHSRKYAALPDLDSAPDIYETPDLTDDTSTLPTTDARSHSSASSAYQDFDEDDEGNAVSRSHLRPDAARSRFEPAQIDARNVDFSDRVNSKRKSYKVSTRRRRTREDGTQVLGDVSDEDDGESLERKLARLRREIEEVKEEFARRQYENNKTSKTDDADTVTEADAVVLGQMLEAISGTGAPSGEKPGSRLTKSLQSGLQSPDATQVVNASTKNGDPATYTVTYTPEYQEKHTLAMAADFDSRLTFLEKALGLTSTAIPAIDSKGTPITVLPTLDRLHRQLSVLAEASPTSLDNISREVRLLTQEADKLDEKRKASTAAKESSDSRPGSAGEPEDTNSEQVSKINALYGTLATIENLTPMLPSLLDRLRSLRAIHADAATASETMNKALKRQEDMATDIKKWKEGLEKVEEAIKLNESTMGGNIKVVEGWVKDLEERMKRL